MTTAQLIPLRAARDRLIELLHLGEPYPLQDLPLGNQNLMVALNIPAQIEITQSQPDVLYQLYHEEALVGRGQTSGAWLKQGDDGEWLQRTPERTWRPRTPQEEADDAALAIEGRGTGSTLTLETFRVQEDITFAIRAAKLTSRRTTILQAAATVKVGLNVQLAAQITAGELLEPTQTGPTAARIIDYGQRVTVAIHNSQEGVDYHLITQVGKPEISVSTPPVRGNLHTIELQSQPFFEDSELRIRATKTFETAEKRASQSDLLEVALPFKVRANPAVAVQADTIIDYGGQAQLTLQATQANVDYQLFCHTLADSEFVRQPLPAGEVLSVAVPDAAAVQVRQPAPPPTWHDPAEYVPMGEPQTGNGGDLTFRLPALTDDSLIIVRARKTHQATQVVPSAVQLATGALILVRPNPAPALHLQVQLAGAATRDDVQFLAGQPGVFYQVRGAPAGSKIGLPAYFHQRDRHDPAINKGLGQLAVEVDLVVARALPAEPAAAGLAAIPPELPSVATGPLPLDTPLAIQANKAQTRVTALIATPLHLPSGPEVAPEKTEVAAGASTGIRIVESRTNEWYQLLLDGQPVGEEVKGSGKNRLLPTGPLTADSHFVLRITQHDAALVVERFVELPVIKITPPVDQVQGGA